ncbi:MAG: YqaJ viral recombinase family protein [Fuerstiella sp.]|nr:YqaJ viral recombinase family protein [Fuerstiella sp.]MCP4853054.1 YqaJ viral recombinase family protein [Fuerstiella sp.]
MPHTNKWHDLRTFDPERTERPVIIGASEIAVACGVSPYSTPLQLYLEKRGEMEKEFSDEQKERMAFGQKLEPVILEAYADRMGLHVDADQPMYFHPDHSWMAATPDGVAFGDEIGQRHGLECKATSWRMYDATGEEADAFGEDGTDQVPAMYVMQTQQQMAVCGFDRVDLPVLFDGSKLRIYHIDRSETIIEAIVAAGSELAERIINNDPPPPDYGHARTQEAIQALYGFDADADPMELDEDADMWTWQVKEMTAQIKEVEKRKAELQNRIIAAFCGASKAVLPNGEKLSRTQIAETYVTDDDVLRLADRVGQVKRKGYERLNLPRKRKA